MFLLVVLNGFGFDNVTNDDKVVSLYAYTGINFTIDYSVVWLYSLATNSWKQLLDAYPDSNMTVSHCDSSSNGRMQNWIWGPFRSHRSRCLLSFNMVDEVFVETPLPFDAPYDVHGFLYQGSNYMYPTVYCISDNFQQLHIWVLEGYGPTCVWNKQLHIRLPEYIGTPFVILGKNKEIVSSPYGSGTITSLNLTTQDVKSLQIPADGNLLAYTESLVTIAKSVRQPPTMMDHSSLETGLLPLHVDDEQDLSVPTMIHRMIPKEEDDDSDDLSTDSAFLTPDITAFTDTSTVYIDYESDLNFYPLRKNEVERLSKLLYCLQEVNKPVISNPSCTF